MGNIFIHSLILTDITTKWLAYTSKQNVIGHIINKIMDHTEFLNFKQHL